VARQCLVFVEEFLGWSPEDVMDFMNLVKLIRARKEGKERKHLKENAPHSPIVHLVVVIPISQQALWRPVPSS